MKTFFALDFDRCLGRVDAYFDLMKTTLAKHALELEGPQLDSARREIEQAGGTFFLLPYLLDYGIISEQALSLVEREFLQLAAERPQTEFLEDGALELIDYIRSQELPCGIVTYGYPRWQQLKLRASRLDVPFVITEHVSKAEVVGAWKTTRGTFWIPPLFVSGHPRGIEVDEVVLVDDKALGFAGLPTGARGYWVKSEQLLPSQMGQVPSSVVTVASLKSIITLEKERRTL